LVKRIINIAIWTLAGLYFAFVILLHIPAIQAFIGTMAGNFISAKLGTEVRIGRIDIGFINRLIIDDVAISDQKGKPMLSASRMSVKVELIPLLDKRISISSSQLFGLKANLYKESADAIPNFLFIIDSLKSKESDNAGSPDLQINSLIIRHGAISYRQLDKKAADGRLSPYSINLKNISGHFILNKFCNDSLNLRVKKLSFDDDSGLHLKALSFKMAGNRKAAELDDLTIELPETKLSVDRLSAKYTMKDQDMEFHNASFEGEIAQSHITLSDLAFILPALKGNDNKLFIDAKIDGTDSAITVGRFRLNAPNGMLYVLANGHCEQTRTGYDWHLNLTDLKADYDGIKTISDNIEKFRLPEEIMRLGEISIRGNAEGHNDRVKAGFRITTDAGNAEMELTGQGKKMAANLKTDDLNLRKITDNNKLNRIAADIRVESDKDGGISADGAVSHIDYGAYTYRDIHFNGNLTKNNVLSGRIAMNDPHAFVEMSGTATLGDRLSLSDIHAKIRDLTPSEIHLSDRWPQTAFSLDLNASLEQTGKGFITGNASIKDFTMTRPDSTYTIGDITLISGTDSDNKQFMTLDSDFGQASITGKFDISSLGESLSGIIRSKLPTVPGMADSKGNTANDIAVKAAINDSQWLQLLLGIPLELDRPLSIEGMLNDEQEAINLVCRMPSFSFNDKRYRDATVEINTLCDTITTSAILKKLSDNGKTFTWKIKADASNNILGTTVNINDDKDHPLKGTINARTNFFKNREGKSTALISIEESDMHIGDIAWHIRPSSIVYNSGCLEINNFSIDNGKQFMSIDGKATKQLTDSISVDFKGMDVAYILDMVNFHSVEFSGQASGKAYIVEAFGKTPQAYADVVVDDFRFENGRMGTLYAKTHYDNTLGQIVIDATAHDTDNRRTVIDGYVSPPHDFIDLRITAHDTRLEFVESLCGSFMRDVDAKANGSVRLSGPLDNINLTGQLVADGSLGISSLNTTYTLRNDTIRFIPDEIEFRNNIVYDRYGNTGIVNGNVHHRHLTKLSYDIDIEGKNILAFDTDSKGSDTFYGTVFATGKCAISGRSGEVTMDIDFTPGKESRITYNADRQNTEDAREFISWKQPAKTQYTGNGVNTENDAAPTVLTDNNRQITSDLRLNFLINCTPDATLKVIMDNRSGDYVTLNGNGTLRATYYNKGSFDIFGNYIVDHGVYKLTVQNIMKKDFVFQEGGIIKFGGNPFAASLDLKALYVLNSVSLSDLNIGRSFSNNNVRVNCLMNVTGTPETPKVTFDLDMPTLSSDAKQMISSVINAEEEMNQQVLYLLAVGRFYTQGNNNASDGGQSTQHNQASLAMQSIMSGTISQQLNSVLGTMINNSNWNFGANISTGTEGLDDAEYEGTLSGRLLNNRLLLNGQFGYRDNPYATTNFIGDFDLKYLLYPNGNLAISVYNKTNDRYFTRNSLNTQGIGLMMKKDFNGLRDLFGIKKEK